MPPDASILQSLAIGLVIAGAIILAWTFRAAFIQSLARFTRRAPVPSKSASDFDVPRRHTHPRQPALHTVMDDAEELAQLIAGRLDRQASRLEQLIAAADDRLTRLEQAAARAQSTPANPPAPPPPRREFTDPLSRQIFDLSDRGLSPIEIARQLSQHTGKVELILALRQR